MSPINLNPQDKQFFSQHSINIESKNNLVVLAYQNREFAVKVTNNGKDLSDNHALAIQVAKKMIEIMDTKGLLRVNNAFGNGVKIDKERVEVVKDDQPVIKEHGEKTSTRKTVEISDTTDDDKHDLNQKSVNKKERLTDYHFSTRKLYNQMANIIRSTLLQQKQPTIEKPEQTTQETAEGVKIELKLIDDAQKKDAENKELEFELEAESDNEEDEDEFFDAEDYPFKSKPIPVPLPPPIVGRHVTVLNPDESPIPANIALPAIAYMPELPPQPLDDHEYVLYDAEKLSGLKTQNKKFKWIAVCALIVTVAYLAMGTASYPIDRYHS